MEQRHNSGEAIDHLWTSTGEERYDGQHHKTSSAPPKPSSTEPKVYHSFLDTLRLYAGWLLAWYVLVYALGGYQYVRVLPFSIPYVIALLPPFAPLVLLFALGSFLFLLLTTLHRAIGRGKLKGLILTILGVAALVWYRMNI